MLESLFQSHNILLFEIDKDARLIRHSQGAEQFVGRSNARAAGAPIFELITGLPDIAGALASRANYSSYGHYLRGEKGEGNYDLHLHALAEGAILLLFRRPRAEMGTTAGEADARQASVIAAMLAHEIRNPLSSIRGAAQLLRENMEEDEGGLTGIIDEEVKRISRLVARFEDMTQIHAAPLERVNIHFVLEEARRAASVGFARNIPMVESYDPSIPDIRANADQLAAMITNLLKNAAEAINEKFEMKEEGAEAKGENAGEIRLETRFESGAKRAEALPVIVVISDNGGGIPDEIIGDIFKPFVSQKPGGTGLGLSLVASAIEEMSGLVEARNRGGGAEFTLRLPLWKPHGAPGRKDA